MFKGKKRGHASKSDLEGDDSETPGVEREKSPEPAGSPHHSSNGGDKVYDLYFL